MTTIDQTHDLKRKSWVASANGHADFPIQNLPFGVFSASGGAPRGGVAIGDSILDLKAALEAGLFQGEARRAAEAASAGTLNGFLALGAAARQALRARLSEILTEGSKDRGAAEKALHASADCKLHLPARIGDYTDFYVGIHHATHVGQLFRPDQPLMPNYKYVPIGYHGRASSVLPSGVPVRRPRGQSKAPDAAAPTVGPSARLDYELELGVWIGGGNALGEPIAIGQAAEHVAGFCLLNDWSARDIQAWEYQPLGPFLGKSFATTISPWIVTPEALAPFRTAQTARPAGDPVPLPYLLDDKDQREGGLALELEVLLLTPGLKEKGLAPHKLSASNARYMYWTVAQMVAHHTSNGCNLQPGDLLGTGTISGTEHAESGSLLESSNGGKDPVRLESGEERRFLVDGDEIVLRARGRRDGYASIGFGDCRAVILPALGG
ncbi:MAG: fumarylacetoacetase [Reyranella sp.]|uniref:fumarylacetoacetase n=1 Tax=Reyranella sp. TaxID=1929291 RepID=UPI0025E69850|nr:fumarylacetoacetase [Reyranella sp.]MBR2815210.1 fumarylacetoacetase [Reyranella sp.]